MSDQQPSIPEPVEERGPSHPRFWLNALVVVVVVGVLVAVAFPTSHGHRRIDGAAQSGLRNAMAAAKSCFTDGSYQDCGPATLAEIEPALDYVDGSVASDSPGTVSIEIDDPESESTGIGMAALSSESDRCFYLHDDPTLGLAYGRAEEVEETACFASDAIAFATEASW